MLFGRNLAFCDIGQYALVCFPRKALTKIGPRNGTPATSTGKPAVGNRKSQGNVGRWAASACGFAPPAPMAPSHSAVPLLTWEGGLENVPPCGASVSYHVDWTL